jgi:hypothetical protein
MSHDWADPLQTSTRPSRAEADVVVKDVEACLLSSPTNSSPTFSGPPTGAASPVDRLGGGEVADH